MRWCYAALALVVSVKVHAQPADPPVQEIEPEPKPAPAPEPKPKPAEPARPEHVHTMDELTIPQSNVRFGINFFGDTSALYSSTGEPYSSFTIGTLGVRLLGTLSPSVDALGELAFETAEGAPLADVEQLLVRWRAGKGQLVVGRAHTDIGYWNTAYHHGLWLQIPIERPRAVRFEDDLGLVPVHWVGAMYTYTVGGVAFTGGVANGRGQIVDDVRVEVDTNDAKAVLAKIRYRTDVLEIGAGGIYDRIADAPSMIRPALPNRVIDEFIANAYLRITGAFEVIAEAYAFRHQSKGDSWMTYSGYGLVGLHVKDWISVYGAVDVVRGADEDPFFTPDPAMGAYSDLAEGIGGLRFETSTWSAIKVEARVLHAPDGPGDDNAFTGAANWSFGL